RNQETKSARETAATHVIVSPIECAPGRTHSTAIRRTEAEAPGRATVPATVAPRPSTRADGTRRVHAKVTAERPTAPATTALVTTTMGETSASCPRAST